MRSPPAGQEHYVATWRRGPAKRNDTDSTSRQMHFHASQVFPDWLPRRGEMRHEDRAIGIKLNYGGEIFVARL